MQRVEKPPVERLLRGIATDHVETVRDSWRALLAQGDGAIAPVRAKLASPAWADPPRGPVAKYLGILLAVLDELDRDAFAEEINRLQKSKLHPLHAKTVEFLSQRLRDAPVAHIADRIPVYVSEDIAEKDLVAANIHKWSRTKGLTLGKITRFDVIARSSQLDYLGLYNMFFSGIVLTWPAKRLRGFGLWFHRLDAEFTFYHEVGHHVCGHTEGGTVAEQEDEANAYARAMFRKAHPVLVPIGQLLLLPLKPLLSKVHPRFR